jgi:hypothetical protein
LSYFSLKLLDLPYFAHYYVLCLSSIADPNHIDADSDPDPACHLDADPDPYPTFHIDGDPDLGYTFDADPDPTFQFDADPDPQYYCSEGILICCPQHCSKMNFLL